VDDEQLHDPSRVEHLAREALEVVLGHDLHHNTDEIHLELYKLPVTGDSKNIIIILL